MWMPHTLTFNELQFTATKLKIYTGPYKDPILPSTKESQSHLKK
jgi:hypothetical protein